MIFWSRFGNGWALIKRDWGRHTGIQLRRIRNRKHRTVRQASPWNFPLNILNMSNENERAGSEGIEMMSAKFAALSRYFTFLPNVPRPQSFRARMADALFVFFLLPARFGFIIGGVVGGLAAQTTGFFLGLLAGGIVGFWIRRSLGLRGRNLTHGFFVRMWERGNGSGRKLLEALVEWLRGDDLTPRTCRLLASAYGEAQRDLQSGPSVAERRGIHGELERKVRAVLYGQAAPSPGDHYAPREESVTQTS